MPYLIYNGVPICIQQDKTGACRVCITDIYAAAGKPKNKAPTNFKNSKQGREQIRYFVKNRGTWVWESRTGQNTQALINLGSAYLIYLGDKGAANALRQVYETGETVTYNTGQLGYNPNPMDDYQYYIEKFISSQSGQIVVTLLIVIALLWISNLFKTPELPHQSPENPIQRSP